MDYTRALLQKCKSRNKTKKNIFNHRPHNIVKILIKNYIKKLKPQKLIYKPQIKFAALCVLSLHNNIRAVCHVMQGCVHIKHENTCTDLYTELQAEGG